VADYWDRERENKEGLQDEDEDFGRQREQRGCRRAGGNSEKSERSWEEVERSSRVSEERERGERQCLH